MDSDIVRLRMEVNLQQKSLKEMISMTRFKANQAAQERNLAKNDLDRLIQSIRDKSNRYQNHEKHLNRLKNQPDSLKDKHTTRWTDQQPK